VSSPSFRLLHNSDTVLCITDTPCKPRGMSEAERQPAACSACHRARDSVWWFYLPEFLRALKRVRATLIRAPAEATNASTTVGSSGESTHPVCARTKTGMHITAITTNSARNLFFITQSFRCEKSRSSLLTENPSAIQSVGFLPRSETIYTVSKRTASSGYEFRPAGCFPPSQSGARTNTGGGSYWSGGP
jgi:hypothetical protein